LRTSVLDERLFVRHARGSEQAFAEPRITSRTITRTINDVTPPP
jgi:hypothetical protein